MFRFACALWLSGCLIAQAQSDNDALAQKAVEAERRGDFAGAVSAFQQLLHNGADSPELRSNLGIAYYQLGDPASALREFRHALTQTPNSIPANLFSGLSLLKLQHPKEALTYLEKSHHAQPNAIAPVLALAEAEIASNDLARANAFYKQASQLDPQSAEAWYGLGITDRALAEKEFERSKRLGVASADSAAARKRATALMDASKESVSKAMQLDPGSVRARMILGESFRIAERYDDAIREYKAATEQQPNLAPAWAGLATAYSAAGDDDNAMKAATRSLELDPNDPATNALVAAIFLRQSDYAKAEPYALRALQIQPDLSSAHVILAKIYLARHDAPKALPELQSAVKDDTDGNTYYLLATTLRELGRTNEAAAALQKYQSAAQCAFGGSAEMRLTGPGCGKRLRLSSQTQLSRRR